MKIAQMLIAALLLTACISNSTPYTEGSATSNTDVETGRKSKEQPQQYSMVSPLNVEWAGLCRRVVNEVGQKINKSPYKSLQSSYLFQENKVVFYVRSFSDKNCGRIFAGGSSTFQCDKNPFVLKANCLKVGEDTLEGNKWSKTAMVDHAGFSSKFTMEFQANLINEKSVKLQSRNVTDSADAQIEELTRP